ncbi:5-deoxyglucuronate isomerase [Gordoniibacillus kamchatkensis]|uniref:5-deoxy-glucuronate isomerase n=1 Tax=Gordoniibacillus kamchatkensis TaxID=1590651 RepID=A0ABR5AKL6_9BACL|nr:5-deoxy-glucuronate isomerase [Paenibacillus sp. VKM B-2647]KIL40902.1 5-deoxyglucuronate isomerase [Paenibacillus sp. VKM B-2647]
MPNLVVKSREPDAEGNVLAITPESAGWSYIGLHVYRLKPGQKVNKRTGSAEVCLTLLQGKANIVTSRLQCLNIGSRMSIFEGTPPDSVYVPMNDEYEIEALTDLEIAVCSAPGKAGGEAHFIRSADVQAEMRGYGNMLRRVHNILPEQQEAGSLLVVEVFTPGGHWSSYPPHKHDRDRLPHESYLEEIYYHRVNPGHGFALQRVYTDDRSLDEAMAVANGDAVLVPKGYHPVSAAPGYDLYYLNVMAGPVRTWKFHNDPDHEWLFRQPAKEGEQ